MTSRTYFSLVVFLFSFLSLNAQDWAQQGQDINGAEANERFGEQVSISDDGQVVAIGSAFTGADSETGVVRIYKIINGEWQQLGSDLTGDSVGDRFGQNLKLSGDGNSILVSEFGNGSFTGDIAHVEVYKFQNEEWQQVGADISGPANEGQFGIGLDINFDGSIVAASTNFDSGGLGITLIYNLVNGTWTQIGNTIFGEASGDNFGVGLALSSDGHIVAIGSRELNPNGNNTGYVKVYSLEANIWVQVGSKISGTRKGFQFGKSLDLNNLGTRLAIGASRNSFDAATSDDRGDVAVYELQNGSWVQLGSIIKGEGATDLASEVSLSGDGNYVAIGASENGFRSGHVRVFSFDGTTWSQKGNDVDGNSGNDFGESLEISANGQSFISGSRFNSDAGAFAGQARVFKFENEPAETEITISESGQLIITDTNGGDSDDDFELSTVAGNLRIKNNTQSISTAIPNAVQIDANTIDVPLPNDLTGIFFIGEGGNNTMKLSPDLDLSGPGQFLVLNDFETAVESGANLQLAGLNVNNGSLDINGATIAITLGEAGFANSILKGIGSISGPVSLYDGASVAPGTSPGIINSGNLTLDPGANP